MILAFLNVAHAHLTSQLQCHCDALNVAPPCIGNFCKGSKVLPFLSIPSFPFPLFLFYPFRSLPPFILSPRCPLLTAIPFNPVRGSGEHCGVWGRARPQMQFRYILSQWNVWWQQICFFSENQNLLINANLAFTFFWGQSSLFALTCGCYATCNTSHSTVIYSQQ